MCGIFGFASRGSRPSLTRLAEIAKATEARGPHAFGFAWLDSANRLRMFKSAGRISAALDVLTMAEGARLLIGHTRWATQGEPAANVNNHPHPVDGGWLVHNGVIRRYQELCRRYELCPVSECDSEVLGLLIEQLGGSLAERCAQAARIAGDSPLALAALWKSPARLVAVRAGNPLFVSADKAGWYFASQPASLPAGAAEVPDETALVWSRSGNGHALTGFDLPPAQRQREMFAGQRSGIWD